jgi:hypothetical protein
MKPISIIALSLFISGCQTSGTPATQPATPDPTTQLTIAADALAGSETVLTALDQAHVIPAGNRAAVAAAVIVAEKDLAAAQANINSPAAQSLLAQLRADLNAVVQLRTTYAAAAPATTKPATAPASFNP